MITENQKNELIQHVANFVGMASIRLPDDVMARLQEMRDNETKPSAITLYDIMIGNQKRAVEVKRPTCQDTGIVHLYVRAGAFSPYLNVLTDVINQAVVKATQQTPLRLNAVETFDEYNTGTNVGTGVPYIEWTIVPDSDKIEMDVYFAGGGCSLPGKSAVLMPAKGYEGIVDFVLDIVTDRGVNAWSSPRHRRRYRRMYHNRHPSFQKSSSPQGRKPQSQSQGCRIREHPFRRH